MARRIRRNSMEHLQLYDLDEITRVPTPYQLPPPLPPPRKLRHYGTTKPTFERYRFLCDAERHKTDPIYAATPMFTTIPQSSKHVHQRRQLLGSRIPSDIIKPVSSSTPKSTEPQTAETEDDKEEEDEEEEKEQEEEEEEEKKKKEEDEEEEKSDDDKSDDDSDDRDESSSSSSSSSGDDDGFDNDDDNRGVVEQIFNRNKKK